MPNAVIKKFAEESGKSIQEVEAAWEAAKSQVEKEYGDFNANYGIVVFLTKKKLGIKQEKPSLKEMLLSIPKY